jgi:hypothetical protein
MKAIITVEVPEHQIGQEVSVYFKDTMCVKGTCESETEVYAKHDEEIIKETVESIWGKPPYTEVLDSIKAEIETAKEKWWSNAKSNYFVKLSDVIAIIDKYRKGDKE